MIDAVGMEAHGHREADGNKFAEAAQKAASLLPDAVAAKVTDRAGWTGSTLHAAIKAVRRAETVSDSASTAEK